MKLFILRISTGLTLAAGTVCLLSSATRSISLSKAATTLYDHKVIRSPDTNLDANIVPLPPECPYCNSPSRVEIRSATRHIMTAKNHTNGPTNEGLSVVDDAWTPDSRFFVYSMISSGGHGPWNQPIFIYSRKRNHIYELERVLGDAISGGWELAKGDKLEAIAFYDGKSYAGLQRKTTENGDDLVTIDLKWLESQKREFSN